MIKKGKTLYAGKCNGQWYVKQAASTAQFTRLVIEEERTKNNFVIPRQARWMYVPDLFWSEDHKAWCNMDGSVYGPKLPKEARP